MREAKKKKEEQQKKLLPSQGGRHPAGFTWRIRLVYETCAAGTAHNLSLTAALDAILL